MQWRYRQESLSAEDKIYKISHVLKYTWLLFLRKKKMEEYCPSHNSYMTGNLPDTMIARAVNTQQFIIRVWGCPGGEILDCDPPGYDTV